MSPPSLSGDGTGMVFTVDAAIIDDDDFVSTRPNWFRKLLTPCYIIRLSALYTCFCSFAVDKVMIKESYYYYYYRPIQYASYDSWPCSDWPLATGNNVTYYTMQ